MLEAIELAASELIYEDVSEEETDDEDVSDEEPVDKELSDDAEDTSGAEEAGGSGVDPVPGGGVEVPPPEPPPPQPCNTASTVTARAILNTDKPVTG